jgi:hypothetical protein
MLDGLKIASDSDWSVVVGPLPDSTITAGAVAASYENSPAPVYPVFVVKEYAYVAPSLTEAANPRTAVARSAAWVIRFMR